MENGRKKVLVVGIAAAVLLILLGLFFGLGGRKGGGQSYTDLLEQGRKYLSELDYGQAVLCFTKAIEIDPNRADAYLSRAEAYAGLGENEKAIEDYRKAEELLPEEETEEIRQRIEELLEEAAPEKQEPEEPSWTWAREPQEGPEIIGMMYSWASEINVNGIYGDTGSVIKSGYFLASQNGKYGLLKMDGSWWVEPGYNEIFNSYGHEDWNYFAERDSVWYRMQELNGRFDEMDWNEGVIIAGRCYVGWLDGYNRFGAYSDQDGNLDMDSNGYTFSGTVSVQAKKVDSGDYSNIDGSVSRYYWVGETVNDGLYAIATDTQLKTDFVFEQTGAYSSGLIAVKQNGKWGYADREGTLVIPCQYDGIRFVIQNRGGQYDEWYGRGALAADCTEGYVVLCKGGEYALYDNTGAEVIPFGEFDALSEVYHGQLWAKKDGKWGVLQLTNNTAPEELSYLDGLAVQPDEPSDGYPVTTKAEHGLSMRTGPGTEYDKIGSIPYLTTVKPVGRSVPDSGWLVVEYEGQYGWVSMEFLQ